MTTVFYIGGLVLGFLGGIGGGIYIERHKPKWAAFLRSKYHDIR